MDILYRRVGSTNPEIQPNATSVAYQSWMLSQIAEEQNDKVQAAERCRAVLEFQRFLTAADHDSIVFTCQKIVSSPATKD